MRQPYDESGTEVNDLEQELSSLRSELSELRWRRLVAETDTNGAEEIELVQHLSDGVSEQIALNKHRRGLPTINPKVQSGVGADLLERIDAEGLPLSHDLALLIIQDEIDRSIAVQDAFRQRLIANGVESIGLSAQVDAIE